MYTDEKNAKLLKPIYIINPFTIFFGETLRDNENLKTKYKLVDSLLNSNVDVCSTAYQQKGMSVEIGILIACW